MADNDKKEPLVWRDPETGRFHFREGTWWPLWALLIIPFLIIFFPLYRFVKKEVHWKAAIVTVIVLEVVLLIAEYYSLQRGHWVYNENRIFGPKIFGVPIEEPLLYYSFPPLIIICLFHAVKKFVHSRENR